MTLEDVVSLSDFGAEFGDGGAVCFAEHGEFLEHFGALLRVVLDLGQVVPHVLVEGEDTLVTGVGLACVGYGWCVRVLKWLL